MPKKIILLLNCKFCICFLRSKVLGAFQHNLKICISEVCNHVSKQHLKSFSLFSNPSFYTSYVVLYIHIYLTAVRPLCSSAFNMHSAVRIIFFHMLNCARKILSHEILLYYYLFFFTDYDSNFCLQLKCKIRFGIIN